MFLIYLDKTKMSLKTAKRHMKSNFGKRVAYLGQGEMITSPNDVLPFLFISTTDGQFFIFKVDNE